LVNESPRLSNYTLGLRVSDDLGSQDNLDLRIGIQSSDVFGGPMSNEVFGSALRGGTVTFVDGDVRKPYTGAPAATMEVVSTKRLEGMGRWTHRMSDDLNFTTTASAVKQTQDSFYEGADYAN